MSETATDAITYRVDDDGTYRVYSMSEVLHVLKHMVHLADVQLESWCYSWQDLKNDTVYKELESQLALLRMAYAILGVGPPPGSALKGGHGSNCQCAS